MSKKINSFDLTGLIEVQKNVLIESVNAAGVKDLISAVTDLYDEISEFEASAPHAAINALTPHLKQVKDTLEQMIEAPMSYVDRSEHEEKKKIVLSPVETDDD
jgi:hypothetical protein